MARIDQATDITLRLSTASGIAESLSNVISFGHDAQDLYDAVIGCEWTAEAVAESLNDHRGILTAHDWQAVRTTPRCLVLEGCDPFGNIEVLRVALRKGEPDMCEGTTLRVSLTNRSRVPLSLSNIVSGHCSVASFENRLYKAATRWDAQSFADAMNRARRDGATYDGNWRPVYTRDDKCAIVGSDSCGNEHTLVIRRS